MTPPKQKLIELLPEYADALLCSEVAIRCGDGYERAEVLRLLHAMGFSLDEYSVRVMNDDPDDDSYQHPFIYTASHVACCSSPHPGMSNAIPYEDFVLAVTGGAKYTYTPPTDAEFEEALAALLS